jgi:hypothetical protein
VRGWRAHTPCRCCAGRGVGKLALLIEPAAGVVELTLFQGPVAASAGRRVRMRALLSEAGGLGESNVALPRMQGFVAATRGRVIQPLRLAVLTRGLVIPPLRLAVVARGLVIPLLWLAVLTRGLSIPSLRLAVVARGLTILSLRLVTVNPFPGLVIPSLRLDAPCTRVAHGACRLRAGSKRLVLESLGVVVARLTLNLAPARRSRRATVTAAIVGAGAWPPGPDAAVVAAVVALATVWHPIPGIRPSAATIFVVEATVIGAAPTVVTAVAIAAAAAAPLAAGRAIAVHAYAFAFCIQAASFRVTAMHIISLPMRCPALVVVVVHLVGGPRMLGGHGVEPGVYWSDVHLEG